MDTRRTAAALTAALFLGLGALFGSLAMLASQDGATVVSRNVDQVELPSPGLFGGSVAVYGAPHSPTKAAECALHSRTGRALSSAKVRPDSGVETRTRNGVTLRRTVTVINPPHGATLACTGLKSRQPVVAVAAPSTIATPALLTGSALCAVAGVLLPLAVLRGLKVGLRTSMLGR